MPGFAIDHLALYQSEEVLRPRLPDVQSLADYHRALAAVCTAFFAAEEKPENFSVVVALKPGNLSKVWFVSSHRSDLTPLASLRDTLEAVPTFAVSRGPVAFAIVGRIAGGDPGRPEGSPPWPEEWKAVARGVQGLSVPDGILARLWPDTTALTESAAPAPPGFVRQILEPTGGDILRPKGWFFQEGHRPDLLMWTISKEDPTQGYTTGVKIQIFLRIAEKTKRTPKQFLAELMAGLRKRATRVIKEYPEINLGLFSRMGVEVEEGKFHILYSCFWGSSDLDFVILSIAGTAKEWWATHAPTFERMAEFSPIDLQRFTGK